MSRARTLISSCALFVAAGVAAIHASCTQSQSHLYIGRLYDSSRDCVGDTTSVDTVTGANADFSCALTCLYGKDPEAGDLIYVSNECPPYPLFFDTSGTDPRCTLALAAVNRNDFCLDDGGSSNPFDGSDVGATDASMQGATDSSSD